MKTTKPTANEAYVQHRESIAKICHNIVNRYGGSFEDVLSEAHEHFMDVYLTHDPEIGSLENDLKFRVYKRLLETKRLEARRKKARGVYLQIECCQIGTKTPSFFSVEDFKAKLSKRAKAVVDAVMEPTIDLAHEMHDQIAGRSDYRWKDAMRRALRQYLTDLSWSAREVVVSFKEISNALTKK